MVNEQIIILQQQLEQLKEHYEQQLKAVIDKHNELLKENKTKGAELMRLRQILSEIKEMLQVIKETNNVYPLQNNLNKILQKLTSNI